MNWLAIFNLIFFSGVAGLLCSKAVSLLQRAQLEFEHAKNIRLRSELALRDLESITATLKDELQKVQP